jgi:hypothetical protein
LASSLFSSSFERRRKRGEMFGDLGVVQSAGCVPTQPDLALRAVRIVVGRERLVRVILVKGDDQIRTAGEEPLPQGRRQLALGRCEVLVEELDILAQVKDEETLLVLVGAEQIRTQPCTPSDHLPKLRLGAYELEEHEVHDFGHVDAHGPGVFDICPGLSRRRLARWGEWPVWMVEQSFDFDVSIWTVL